MTIKFGKFADFIVRNVVVIPEAPNIARYCDTIAAIPHIARYFKGVPWYPLFVASDRNQKILPGKSPLKGNPPDPETKVDGSKVDVKCFPSTILTEMMTDEFTFLWSQIQNCIAQADAD